MSFITDKQTLEELNLLGKFRQGSIYNIFNRVKTRGGEQLLDSMFRQPLSQPAEINVRSAVFMFFQQTGLSFPFDVQQVNGMREYLENGAQKNFPLTWAGIVLKKGLAVLTRDEQFKKTVQGLQATIVTLNRCQDFVEAVRSAMHTPAQDHPAPGGTGVQSAASAVRAPEHPYARRVQSIREILNDKRLEKLRNTDIYQSLSIRTLAQYDHLLKARLHKEIGDILSFIYENDVNSAVGEVARQRGFNYAKALPPEENIFSVAGLCHPSIEGAVGNTLSLEKDSNVLFLTGANMAGKSTLMKSIGIGLYLAHMGFPVAAEKMEFSVREGLYSSINVADNIGLGYSHFYAEVVRVKQAADAAAGGKRLLLMFDELFKGTNVKDAYDGTLAVTEAFAGYRKCLFVVSTHIIEVGEALRSHSNIRFAYMPTIMDGLHPRYTYRLQEGITEDRQGMMIIRNEGIPELLERKAN